jgi:hypothetical protein
VRSLFKGAQQQSAGAKGGRPQTGGEGAASGVCPPPGPARRVL